MAPNNEVSERWYEVVVVQGVVVRICNEIRFTKRQGQNHQHCW